MIGDLGSDVPEADARLLKYVDDTKAMKGVKTTEDVEEFQGVIMKLNDWKNNNNMLYNSSKF